MATITLDGKSFNSVDLDIERGYYLVDLSTGDVTTVSAEQAAINLLDIHTSYDGAINYFEQAIREDLEFYRKQRSEAETWIRKDEELLKRLPKLRQRAKMRKSSVREALKRHGLPETETDSGQAEIDLMTGKIR